MCTEFRTVDPKGYFQYFLDKKLRPDGRELGTIREICVNVGNITTADGSSLVKLGNTTVVCGIKGELVTPAPDKPNVGFVVPNVDLPALCSPRYKPGPPSEQAQVVTQLLADVIRNADCIELEDLCIYPGKLVWCLYIDIVCLNYDGNVVDASMLAILAALRTCSLAKVRAKEDGEGYNIGQDRAALKVGDHVVATTFALFNGEPMVDPTEEEERLADGILTLVVGRDGNICVAHKPGGIPISDEQMKSCVHRAKMQTLNVSKLLSNCIKSKN